MLLLIFFQLFKQTISYFKSMYLILINCVVTTDGTLVVKHKEIIFAVNMHTTPVDTARFAWQSKQMVSTHYTQFFINFKILCHLLQFIIKISLLALAQIHFALSALYNQSNPNDFQLYSKPLNFNLLTLSHNC